MNKLKLLQFRPASIRVYIPELVALIEPGGRIVENLAACFDGPLEIPDGSGRVLPAGYYWTDCPQPCIHDYTIRGIVWDDYGQWGKSCCFDKDYTDGLNPLGSGCFSPSCADPTKWWTYLPDPLPDFPVVLLCPDIELAIDQHDSLWWY